LNWSFGASPGVWVLAAVVLIACGWISLLNWRRSGQRAKVVNGYANILRGSLKASPTLLKPKSIESILLSSTVIV
jgi:hypothetical protein